MCYGVFLIGELFGCGYAAPSSPRLNFWFDCKKVGYLLPKTASFEAEVYRIIAAGMIVKGWHQRGYQPMPYGTLTVLGSHSCVALSPVKATELYHTMPEA